ncbi:hypothetical protein COHA_001045 [Chlorella ohadii]|uniref:Uncharacterized protein n=1 Tax=Chlorella ohadii TaxID=2649997 RepID=A0AAD5DZC6_9CHLO|nr:hypothetical protein COHA_001045 [Chlorella ohadii]
MAFLAEFLALSAPSQAVVLLVIGTAAWIVTRVDTTPRQVQQQPKGVSLKQLQREAAKGKGHHHGADKHASSKLFITGLRGHTAEVTGLSWSPDGESLATACDDRTVRVFDLRDPTAKSIPCRKKELLRCGVQDVAFGDDAQHVAVLTKGMVNAAGLMMLNFAGTKEPAEEWNLEGIFNGKLPGLCLASASSSKGGYGVLAASSNKTDLRVFNTLGRQLGQMDTGGLNNYMATISRDGRWVAAGTFTSDVKLYEVQFDRTGQFTGVKMGMSLKGHKSKVFCIDFSPDLTKMVTASGDGLLKIWNIAVRFHMDEDPKVLLSTGLSLLPGKCYSRLAWGPENLIAAACGSMLHFLDCRTGEVVERIDEAHDAAITSLEWSTSKLRGPHGPAHVLATAGLDGRVRLWAAPQRLV